MIPRWAKIAAGLPLLLVAFAVGGLEWRRAYAAEIIDRDWQTERVAKVRDLGSTRTLEILPLVNWHRRSGDLMTEPGVAYLVRTDSMTILFDAGFNQDDARPSSLEQNMARLGISFDEIDAVFVSHGHRDHVGRTRFEREGSFSVGASDKKLAGRPLFAPGTLRHLSMRTVPLTGPQRIETAVATTGPIARSLVMGTVQEQALVINVEGRGLVTIVGCGHQTIAKLLTRLDDAFDEPLYGIVGDLHYPVPRGRLNLWGIDVQRWLASGDGIFSPVTMGDVTADMAMIAARRPGLVALGGHDTSDEVIDAFQARFGSRYERVEVGALIRLRP